jgi:hypothetical protein
MQYAEGLSIRMAEIVAASYGNLRSGSMIIEQTERYVKCRGFCHDLETNNAVTTETMEPTVKSDGSTFSEGMRAVVAKACLKKALRDSIFSVVPKALCRPIESEARKVMAGDAKSMEFRRQAVMTWVNKLGIDTARVFAALGVVGESDITTEHLTTLTGLKTAIKDGDIKIEEAFPPITEDTGETVKPDFLKKKAQDKPAETPPATPDPKQQDPEPDDDAIRKTLVGRLEDARMEAQISITKVKEFAVCEKLVDSLRTNPKDYPVSALQFILDHWSEILA